MACSAVFRMADRASTRFEKVRTPTPGEVSPTLAIQLAGVVVRVPTLKPLSRQMLAVAALLSEGWNVMTVAAMLGIEDKTAGYHICEAAKRVPGDLEPPRARLVAWYRGAPLSVLRRSAVMDERDLPASLRRHGAMKRALDISQGRGCPVCGYDGVQLLPKAPVNAGSNGVVP